MLFFDGEEHSFLGYNLLGIINNVSYYSKSLFSIFPPGFVSILHPK